MNIFIATLAAVAWAVPIRSREELTRKAIAAAAAKPLMDSRQLDTVEEPTALEEKEEDNSAAEQKTKKVVAKKTSKATRQAKAKPNGGPKSSAAKKEATPTQEVSKPKRRKEAARPRAPAETLSIHEMAVLEADLDETLLDV